MSDPQPPAISNLETSIHNLARIVRDARHIDPDAQKALADLVDVLSNSLHAGPLPAEETARLAESAAHLASALHQRHEATVLAQARDRFQDAVALAQVRVPVITGVARRLLDVLADLGI